MPAYCTHGMVRDTRLQLAFDDTRTCNPCRGYEKCKDADCVTRHDGGAGRYLPAYGGFGNAGWRFGRGGGKRVSHHRTGTFEG